MTLDTSDGLVQQILERGGLLRLLQVLGAQVHAPCQHGELGRVLGCLVSRLHRVLVVVEEGRVLGQHHFRQLAQRLANLSQAKPFRPYC